MVFNPKRQTSWIDSLSRDIASFIVHITGEPAPIVCERCMEGRGPYQGCIVISARAPERPRKYITSCSNCLYQSGQRYCNLQSTLKERFEKSTPGEHDNDKTPMVRREDAVGDERCLLSFCVPRQKSPSTESGGAPSAAAHQRQGRQDRQAAEPTAFSPAVRATANALPPASQKARSTMNTSVVLASSLKEPRSEDLYMEDWEAAPGRLRSDVSETPDSKLPVTWAGRRS